MTKTWDEFIARQVEAVLKGERITSEVWEPSRLAREDIHENLRDRGKGLTWVYTFGGWGTGDYWWVNLTEMRVLHRTKP